MIKKGEGGGEGGGGGGGGEGVRLRAPDGGWGWMVALGCYFVCGLFAILPLSYSILFSRYLMDQGASTTTTNWILNLHQFFHNFAGPLVGPLVKEVGFRKVSVVTSILAVLIFLSLVFLNSTWYLMVLFGGSGLFIGLATKPSYLIMAQYFDRRRGIANAILMAGICSAQFAGPPLIRYLLDEYSLRGTILVLGGVLFHSTAAACLYQPVEWHMKPVEEEEEVKLKVDDKENAQRECKLDIVGTKENEPDEAVRSKLQDLQRQKVIFRNRGIRQASECSINSLSLGLSHVDLSSVPSLSRLDVGVDEADEAIDQEDNNKSTSILSRIIGTLKTLLHVFHSILSDMTILRSPRAIIIVGGGVCTVIGYLNFLIMAPFAIQNAGYSLSDAAWCLAIAGLCNMVARLSTSALSDCSWFNMRAAYMTGATILAASTIVFGFLTELMWMQVVMGVWGYGVGITISLYILIMPKFMGLENMPAIFGTQSFVLSFAFLIVGPLIGLIRDVTDSYTVAICVTGAFISGCVLLWAFMPAAVESDRRRQQDKDSRKQQEMDRQQEESRQKIKQ